MSENLFNNLTPSPKRTLTLFYLVDCSGSMKGWRIGAVNTAMEEAFVHDFNEELDLNDDTEIKVAILEFGTEVKWKVPEKPEDGPVDFHDLDWNDLVVKEGAETNMGAAFKELNDKLSKEKFLPSVTGQYAPVLILISDGYPVDSWKAELAELQKNVYYKQAVKIAIAIGNDVGKDVLAKFTNTPDAVISVNDRESFYNLLKKVSVITGITQSQSTVQRDNNSTPEAESKRIIKLVYGGTDTIDELNGIN